MANRLTDKRQVTSRDLFKMEVDCDLEEVAKWYNKLSHLEDIEEELGVDLIEFFKHIYLVDKKREAPPFRIKTLETLKQNHGKTWALTKEELV